MSETGLGFLTLSGTHIPKHRLNAPPGGEGDTEEGLQFENIGPTFSSSVVEFSRFF